MKTLFSSLAVLVIVNSLLAQSILQSPHASTLCVTNKPCNILLSPAPTQPGSILALACGQNSITQQGSCQPTGASSNAGDVLTFGGAAGGKSTDGRNAIVAYDSDGIGGATEVTVNYPSSCSSYTVSCTFYEAACPFGLCFESDIEPANDTTPSDQQAGPVLTFTGTALMVEAMDAGADAESVLWPNCPNNNFSYVAMDHFASAACPALTSGAAPVFVFKQSARGAGSGVSITIQGQPSQASR